MDTIDELVELAEFNARCDGDISYYSSCVAASLMALLDGCDIVDGEDDTPYTTSLVYAWFNSDLDHQLPGGSAADYCAEAVMKAFSEKNVHLENADYDTQQTLIAWITDPESGLLDPNRELEILENNGVI